MKMSVEMFTKYYELEVLTLKKHGFPNCCKIVSHFKALYYYREGDYVKLLNTCNSIFSNEVSMFSPGDRTLPKSLTDYLCVPVAVAFQTLFRNDVPCLTGLIALIGRHLFFREYVNWTGIVEMKKFENIINSRQLQEMNNIEGLLDVEGCKIFYFWEQVSRLFLVYYLRFQSLFQLNYPKSAILSALNDLIHARIGEEFEDILLLFVGMTLKRLR